MTQTILQRANYHNAELRLIEKLLLTLKAEGKSTLLDVGCGKGTYAPVLQTTGLDFYGVDINPEMLELARNNGHRPVSTEHLEASGQHFDIILISHVIEHLHYKELYEFLDYYIQKLSPDGRLIIASPLLVSNFYFDFTHERPYYPQAIWQVFGDYNDSLSIAKKEKIKLEDIYFVKDSFRTRSWRSYYIRNPRLPHLMTHYWNVTLALIYLRTGYRFGKKVSWIGVYKKK